MPSLVNRRVSAAMEEAAADSLQMLLAAERLTESAEPVGLAALMVLLALKAGPARPAELAEALRSPQTRMRQRLLRLRTRGATREFVEGLPDGRYRLSLKGHRFVNRIAALAYHTNRLPLPSQP